MRMRWPGRCCFRRQIARAVEEHEIVAERGQHQRGRAAEQRKADDEQPQAAAACASSPRACARAAAGRDRGCWRGNAARTAPRRRRGRAPQPRRPATQRRRSRPSPTQLAKPLIAPRSSQRAGGAPARVAGRAARGGRPGVEAQGPRLALVERGAHPQQQQRRRTAA